MDNFTSSGLQAARRRLIFDEFFSFIIGIRRQKATEALPRIRELLGLDLSHLEQQEGLPQGGQELA